MANRRSHSKSGSRSPARNRQGKPLGAGTTSHARKARRAALQKARAASPAQAMDGEPALKKAWLKIFNYIYIYMF